MKALIRFWCWAKWKMGLRPPWVSLPAGDPWTSDKHGEHRFEAVSRHAIAETGLLCPRCLNEICARGDFTKIREGVVGALRNEVILCDGVREVNGDKKPCGCILVCSPDTEHGDNILWDKVPKEQREKLFFRFRRISEEEMLKEKYGFDVKRKEGELMADPEEAKGEPTKHHSRFSYSLDDVWVLSNGRMGHVTEVMQAHEGDKYYAGWCIMEIDGDGVRWFVDPYGVVHRDMTDPTMNNLQVVHKQQMA